MGTSPDNRQRGAVKLNGDESVVIHCFNCNLKIVWRSGQTLSNKLRSYLKSLGFNQQEIQKINFNLWQRRTEQPTFDYHPSDVALKFEKRNLPEGAKPFGYWETLDDMPEGFLKASEYLLERGEEIYSNYDFYWSPDARYMNRVIIPFYWQDELVGWSARSIGNDAPRYFSDTPKDFLFNSEVLEKARKYVILVEGVFDAIAIDGVAVLGNSLSDQKVAWLKSSGKEIILLPDREESGKSLVMTALENQWQVSFPEWEDDIKDAADAVGRYGRLFTLQSILHFKTDNRTKIEVMMKWMK